jgi:hypothetical protein
MRKTLIGLAALASAAVATPAAAQHWGHHGHWRGGPGFGFSIGVPGPYAYAPGPYAYGCETVRVRHITPSGRVIYRFEERC